jgi:hypothetical protein
VLNHPKRWLSARTGFRRHRASARGHARGDPRDGAPHESYNASEKHTKAFIDQETHQMLGQLQPFLADSHWNIFWANLTPFSLPAGARGLGAERWVCSGRAALRCKYAAVLRRKNRACVGAHGTAAAAALSVCASQRAASAAARGREKG